MNTLRKSVFAFLCVSVLAGLGRQSLERIARSPALDPVLLRFRAAVLLAEPPDGYIAMPLTEVRVNRVANTWHAGRPGSRRHEGQDLFAPRGTRVLSATDGVVVKLGTAGLGGNSVSVLGRGGRVYYYAHLLRFADGLRPGSVVTRRTVLGYVGNTGNARTTPPHLYFGVYAGNGALNPLPLLEDRSPART